MAGGCVESLEPGGQAAIRALASALAEDLHRWAGGYGNAFDPCRFDAISLTAAYASPWLDPGRLRAVTRTAIWICAVDDAIDERLTGAAGVSGLVRAYQAVAAGAAPDPADPLALSLAEIRAELGAMPLFRELAPLWRAACQRMLEGMRFEWETGRAVAAGEPPPPLSLYMRHGRYSIGVPWYVLAFWMAAGEPDLPAHLDRLLPALCHAAAAVRLANDLRTCERERREGNLNALMLGVNPERAQRRLSWHLERCQGWLQRVTVGPVASALALARLTRFTTDFYAVADYRP